MMTMNKMLKHVAGVIGLLLVICIRADQDERYAIVFDVGGVLIKESRHRIGSEVVQTTGLLGAATHISSLMGVKKVYFQVMDHVGRHIAVPVPAYDKGDQLPHGFSVYMSGLMSAQELHDEACSVINAWSAEDACSCYYHKKRKKHFESSYQACFVENLVHLTLNAQQFITFFVPIQEGHDLLNRCAQQTNQFGGVRHELFILSNFDTDLWHEFINNVDLSQPVCDHIPQSCSLCGDGGLNSSHCLVSGIFKSATHIKPNLIIFELLLHRCAQHGILPDHVIFIDDTLQNVVAARQLGIYSYHVRDKKSFGYIATDLEEREILQPCH